MEDGIVPAGRREEVSFTFDGRKVTGHNGQSIAAALLAAGIRTLRRHERSGAPRGVFCGIGRCQGCRVTVDGVPGVPACVTPVREGMEVTSVRTLPPAEQSPSPPGAATVWEADVAVVGAGPAGLSAALSLARRGFSVAVLDELPRVGGCLPGQLYENPHKPAGQRWWDGRAVAGALEESARAAGVRFFSGAQVWNLTPGWRLFLAGQAAGGVGARAVLLATGAMERALPVPGWTLPGVMTVGAAQVLTRVHGVQPGNRVFIVGIDPLALAIARELTLAGVHVCGLALPPPGLLAGTRAIPGEVTGQLARFSNLAPNTVLQLAGRLFGGRRKRLGARLCPAQGIKVWGIPLYLRRAVVRVTGATRVEAVTLAGVTTDGRLGDEVPPVPADAVCLSGGLAPLAELAVLAGGIMLDIPELGGTVPLYGPDMQTTMAGLFVAGNITGVESAPVAMAQGTLAALGITAYLAPGGEDLAIDTAAAREQLARARRETPLQFYPDAAAGRRRLASAWSAWDKGRRDDTPGAVSGWTSNTRG